MKLAKNIILSLTVVFFIIGAHQTFTLGFDVSYWIFMLSISMYLTYRLMGNMNKEKSEKSAKKKGKKKFGSRDQSNMNRQAKRHMERMGLNKD